MRNRPWAERERFFEAGRADGIAGRPEVPPAIPDGSPARVHRLMCAYATGYRSGRQVRQVKLHPEAPR
jgi:hypothetical protein